jgi:hypothetical protein
VAAISAAPIRLSTGAMLSGNEGVEVMLFNLYSHGGCRFNQHRTPFNRTRRSTRSPFSTRPQEGHSGPVSLVVRDSQVPLAASVLMPTTSASRLPSDAQLRAAPGRLVSFAQNRCESVLRRQANFRVVIVTGLP